MWLILIEAALAGGLLIFFVWWTMFSGRNRGERDEPGGPGEGAAGSSEKEHRDP